LRLEEQPDGKAAVTGAARFLDELANLLKTELFKRFFGHFCETALGRGGVVMALLGMLFSASAWLAPVGALAVLGMIATLVLLRDYLRLESRALSLQAEIEHLRRELQARAKS
jgi:hypothetical protein